MKKRKKHQRIAYNNEDLSKELKDSHLKVSLNKKNISLNNWNWVLKTNTVCSQKTFILYLVGMRLIQIFWIRP